MSTVEVKSTTKLSSLPNGTTLLTQRYQVETENEIPSATIVCIHGLGSTSTTFYPIIPPLLTAFPTAHVLAYDWAGSGASPLPTARGSSHQTVSDHVADLDALISTEAPSGPLVVLAHSAGTLLASRWLLTSSAHVARVTHVVYLGGPIDVPVPASVTEMQVNMAAAIAAGGPAAVVDSLTPTLLGKTSVAERPVAVAALRAVTLSQSAEGYAGAIRAFSEDLREGAELIDWDAIQRKAKVLAVVGEEDVIVSGKDVAALLDRSTVQTILRAGQ